MKVFYFFIAMLLLVSAAPIVYAAHFEVLLINGDSEGALKEAPVVKTKTEVGGHTFAFTEINIGPNSNRPPAGAGDIDDFIGKDVFLADFQIIYFSWNGPGHDGSYFMEPVEDVFLAWAEAGGMVYMSAMDDNFPNAPGAWMPTDKFPLIIDNTGDAEGKITAEGQASTIFSKPNAITEGDISSWILDDNFRPGNARDWEIYAERGDNGQPVVCFLQYEKGGYLQACIDARTTFPAAEELVENVLFFLAERSPGLAVKPAGKLATTWGEIRR